MACKSQLKDFVLQLGVLTNLQPALELVAGLEVREGPKEVAPDSARPAGTGVRT